MGKKIIRGFFLTLLVPILLLSGPVQAARERIINYDARIDINEDASVVIRETIRVISTGNQIQRGIYREIPTVYKDRYGNRVRVDFRILSVSRDGHPEPYHTERVTNGIRIYIGRENVILTPGQYSYTLTYSVDRVLGFFGEHDELYWNVTGNGWIFPIDTASATVVVPGGVPAASIKTAAYTGPQGSTKQDYTVTQTNEGVEFTTTRGLGPGEGLTIVVGWPKGFVSPPTSQDKLAWFFRDNLGALLIIVGLAAVFLWYLFAWVKVGRDPRKGIIIPRYSPPEGVSPAAMRYVRKMGFDNKAFTAAVINLAVQGRLTIREEGKNFVLANTGRQGSGSAEEDSIHSRLFSLRDEITLVNTNHDTIGGAISNCRKELAARYKGEYFKSNGLWLLPGLALSLVFTVLGLLSSREGFSSLFMAFWLSIWSVGVFLLLKQVWSSWKQGKTGATIGLGCLSTIFVAGWLVGAYFLLAAGGLVLSLALAGIIIINLLFAKLLKAPTYAGRKLLDEIEGFRMFLAVAEQDYLQWSAPPERTPELFEKYLPHALALDVDQQWAEKFAGVLAASAVDGQYRPVWYQGRSFTGFSAASLSSNLATSLNSAIASSGVAPGSSSGFSGGSSGGGGGGGGGGGW
jgi:uncharacterized membrane protein YgcG